MIARRAVLKAGALAVLPAVATPVGAANGKYGPGRIDGLPMPAPLAGPSPRLPETDFSRTLIGRGWRFHEGDVAFPEPEDHNATYLSVKAGNATGAAAFDFDDSDWPEVSLPHDWAIAQDVSERANVSEGYRPRGIGWYRRLLRLSPDHQGRRLELHFDGIASHATVWINGSEVAHSFSGYSSVIVDITPFARYGDALNWIAVRVDASVREGWWYEGAGLYRHAWLISRPPVSIATDGVHCDPVEAQDGSWTVPITVTLDNVGAAASNGAITARLFDQQGRQVAQGSASALVPALDHAHVQMTLNPGPVERWSPDEPVLYRLEIDLSDSGQVDRRHVAIAFRTVRFDPARGLILNGEETKLRGVCIHQDHTGVGTAIPDSLVLWRLQRLKAMGCNAIRMTHNAPSQEVLDWCDRLGFLVMTENRIFNPAPDYMAQLEWMVRRDRNHPCVIVWSIFNEEPMQGTYAGVEMLRRMYATVRRLDPQRAVTGAMNGGFYNPDNVSSVLDLVGFNYYQNEYDKFHALHPDKPITSSEDTSAYETRGAFHSDPARHVITSLDKEAASWGASHRESWKMIAERPYVAGGFVWTGFDYHGEPTPYAWPTVSSFFGIMDLCGFPKTAFGIRSAQWRDDAPFVWLAPHWTWPGSEGQTLEVFAITNAEALEVRLNGQVLHRIDKADRNMGHSFDVGYAPGRLEAVAYVGGRVVARAIHETAGLPVALRLTPARTALAGDGEDAQPITVDAVDAQGRHVPIANVPVDFTIAGGTIVGLGNGNPNSHESEKGSRRSLFNGLAQVIVQGDQSGRRLFIRAHAPGLRSTSLSMGRAARTARAQVAVVPSQMVLGQWRRSALMIAKPSVALAPVDGDNNSWDFVQAGALTEPGPAGWRAFHVAFTPWRRVAAQGGTVQFAGIAGRAEVWVDGVIVARKDSAAIAPLSAPIGPGPGGRDLTVVIEADAGEPAGLARQVSVTPLTQ
ncbi:glycosyl hydrolases family 2, sugar binding domain protein [Novosphingobium sp. Rr 2-17]|uniref:beta-galactosidase GalA n=1 Tax=Novosphingobium sp. Rr 2-17 TaxID=555793 RepID=UPI0002697EE7|nr:beta-galactosidase GalA [Novosphingobium sp. Rr 2-17]EIZ78364.1 glycosyl hydrolases family 2, sugar binding domain protein [Novosphingobium sp. Rr 2-17]